VIFVVVVVDAGGGGRGRFGMGFFMKKRWGSRQRGVGGLG